MRRFGFRSWDAEGGWLGVGLHDLTDQLRIYFGVEEDLGVLVSNVYEDSPAEKAGLKAGDVITHVNDRTIEDASELIRAIRRREPGDEVIIKYVRGGKTASASATLAETAGRWAGRRHGSVFFGPDCVLEFAGPDFDGEHIRELEIRLGDEIEEGLRELRDGMQNIRIEVNGVPIQTI